MFEKENNILLSSLLGAGVAVGSSLILVILSALILNFTADPAPLIAPTAKAILYITCIVGGYIAKLKSEKLTAPIVSGALVTVLILLISMLTEKSAAAPVSTVISYILVPLAFLAGGIIHTLITSKRPRRKRRRR